MGKKIVFIGAGSMVFTRNLVRDLLSFPALQDVTIALVDIDETNLNYSRVAAERIVREGNYPARVIATTDRAQVLEGADGVVLTIAIGDPEQTLIDCGIPESYGVTVAVGDTRGPSGIFRYLRTIPAVMEIVRDMERYCPGALLLNYTNPMAMICRTIQAESRIQTTGLCHSVQGTAEMLAGWIGAPMEEITYLCAGINHQAHYLHFRWKGQDAYPLIREVIRENSEVYRSEKVRNEMFLALQYYVTESSVHNSEYNAWFRKRPDLLAEYLPEGSIRSAEKIRDMIDGALDNRRQRMDKWLAEPVDLTRGHEYAASIFNAVFGDGALFAFNGNVRNRDLIDNLPDGCCVEVPVLASREGLQSVHVGALPPQLALLNTVNAQVEELAVQAYLSGDREKLFLCNCFDPLTSAVLSLREIRAMTDEMCRAAESWLPI